jgi:hypothetical protein
VLLIFVFLLFAAISSGQRQPTARQVDARPLVGLLRNPHPTAKQLRAGAVYALGIGYVQAAKVLRDRADFVENVRIVVRLIDTKVVSDISAPWDDVTDVAWKQYVRASRLTDADRDGRDWLIGIFGLSPRLLERLGIMADVKRDGDRWAGRWTGIISSEWFAKSLPAQVQAFTAISRLHRDESRGILDGMVGKEIAGQVATLSGLLAVALRANGRAGLESWLNSEADRRKFKRTTAAYQKLNGIF